MTDANLFSRGDTRAVMERDEYQRNVCVRSGEALNVPFKPDVRIGEWQPKPSECHQNVDYFVQHRDGHGAVRGWLRYASFGDDHVGYTAHSVVQSSDGKLFDITPVHGQTPMIRWFIPHIGDEQLFLSIRRANLEIQCIGCVVAPSVNFEQLCQMQDVEIAPHRRDC